MAGKPFSEVARGGAGNMCEVEAIYQLVGKYFSILISFPANYHPCIETDSLCTVF